MRFPKSRRRATLPRIHRARRALNWSGFAIVAGLIGSTLALALPSLAQAMTTGAFSLPTVWEPWRVVLAILLSSAATATAAYRFTDKGGANAAPK